MSDEEEIDWKQDHRVKTGKIVVHSKHHVRIKTSYVIDDLIPKHISFDQHRAAIRLWIDYTVSHMEKSILARMGSEELPGNINLDMLPWELRQDAGNRYRVIMAQLNTTSWIIARRLIIENWPMPDIVREHFSQWSKRNNGMDRLKETLDEILYLYEEIDNAHDCDKRHWVEGQPLGGFTDEERQQMRKEILDSKFELLRFRMQQDHGNVDTMTD